MATNTTLQHRPGGWKHRLLYPLAVLAAWGGTPLSAAAQAPAAAGSPAPARTVYRIVHLSPSANGPLDINGKGQVAFTEDVGGDRTMARFYDGSAFRDLGTLGGAGSHANALNNDGQVTGGANFSPASTDTHAYRWTAQTGMLSLHRPPDNFATSAAFDINDRGQIAGYLPFFGPIFEPLHATRWSADNVPLDLGTLNGPSLALAINETGQVAGNTRNASGNGLAFRWTDAGGMVGLGTLGGADSDSVAINAGGHVAGHSATPSGLTHAFLWTPERGMIDLGPRRPDADAFTTAMNDSDVVVGTIRIVDGPYRAFAWTRQAGMKDLGTFGGRGAYALDVNNAGQVVGTAETRGGASRAFVWTAASGMVDLNARIPMAPPGFVARSARAISDNGAIVADSNAGLVLLIPRAATHVAPAIGPITLAAAARAGKALALSAAFTDADAGDTHRATWSWGDGSKDDAGVVTAKDGTGSVSGKHTYRAAGLYTVKLTLTDSSGKSATVQRTVAVCGQAGVGGEGGFMSPPGAAKARSGHAAPASYAFFSERQGDGRRAQGPAMLRFSTAQLLFESKRVDSVTVKAARIAYRGSGTINGAGIYQFAFTTGAHPKHAGRRQVHMRIWHVDPASNRELVDYDHQHTADSGEAGMDGDGAGAPDDE